MTLALSRGLELDTQRSSRDSIQCSSGYSTQTNTPCCSEDTIPSQGTYYGSRMSHHLFPFVITYYNDPSLSASLVSDYDYFSIAGDQEPEQQQSDFDKSSTIPRNSDISQSYRRKFQTKRPASTAGLPSTQAPNQGQGAYPAGHCPATPIHTGAYPCTPAGAYPSTPTGTVL